MSLPPLSQCMGINPLHRLTAWKSIRLLIFYETSPRCHSAWESIPCIVTLHERQFPALSHSMRVNLLLIFHESFPPLSHCKGIDPLHCHSPWNQSSFSYSMSLPPHCHSAWESIPCTVSQHGNQSPSSFSMRLPLAVTVHGNQSISCTVTQHGSQSLFSFSLRSPWHCHREHESISCTVTVGGLNPAPHSHSVREFSHIFYV